MTERLLQFIWQFQHFNAGELQTVSGEEIQIVQPGLYNTNQGPDFLDARIRAGTTFWAGHVELHIKASDWDRHMHTGDKHYNNVILHVVWENDRPVGAMPVLELSGRVPLVLINRYVELMNNNCFIPCGNSIGGISNMLLTSWKDRLLVERLSRKNKMVMAFQDANNQHWEETFWWLLARNFGIKINEDAFEAVARSIPLRLLATHRSRIHQLEALLLGQAGLLEESFADQYPVMLQKEYRFLRHKYGLRPIHHHLHFLRMRPGNFPGVRLAQLAMLIHQSSHLFSMLRDARTLDALRQLFQVEANDYWHYHYRFDEPSAFRPKKLGMFMIDNILLNTVFPVLFSWAVYHSDRDVHDRVIDWMAEMPAEQNKTIRSFKKLGIGAINAADTQSLIELKAQYCDQRRCLDCAIGNTLLK